MSIRHLKVPLYFINYILAVIYLVTYFQILLLYILYLSFIEIFILKHIEKVNTQIILYSKLILYTYV